MDRRLRVWIERLARKEKIPTFWITPDPYAKRSVSIDPRTGLVREHPSRPRLQIARPRADAIELIMRAVAAAQGVGALAALAALRCCPRCRWWYATTDLGRRKLCARCGPAKRAADARARAARSRAVP